MITASAAMEVAMVINKHKRYDKWEILLKLYPNESKRNYTFYALCPMGCQF